jgi:predicted CXXCH cytochrome family protein
VPKWLFAESLARTAFGRSLFVAPMARTRFHLRWIKPILIAAMLSWLAAPIMGRTLDDGAPLPWGSKPVSIHAPYASRDCTGCHTKRSGGPLLEGGDNLCLACHEDARKHVHAPRNCIKCHNAHDGLRKKLLRADLEACAECHAKK